MINETNGKIVIEAKEDKRLEVAIELAKTVNNLSEMLKNMETTISNISINGCNIQTTQGETAIHMGNGVRNTMVSNNIIRTETPATVKANIFEDGYEDDYYEEDEDYTEDDVNISPKETKEKCEEVSQFEKSLKKRMSELGLKDYVILKDFDCRFKNDMYIVTAANYRTWEFYVGKGVELDEALRDLRPIMNMCDPKFKEVRSKHSE